jgi:hypothetical protein
VTARGPKNKSTPFRVGSTPANRDEERGRMTSAPRKPQVTSCNRLRVLIRPSLPVRLTVLRNARRRSWAWRHCRVCPLRGMTTARTPRRFASPPVQVRARRLPGGPQLAAVCGWGQPCRVRAWLVAHSSA